MFLRYGNYQHASAEAAVTYAIQCAYSPHKFRTMLTHKLKIRGKLLSDNVPDLVNAINELRAGYDENGFGIGLFQDNGAPTDMVINANDTLGGVRLGQLSFPEDGEKTAEYTTFRTYEIEVEADYLDTHARDRDVPREPDLRGRRPADRLDRDPHWPAAATAGERGHDISGHAAGDPPSA